MNSTPFVRQYAVNRPRSNGQGKKPPVVEYRNITQPDAVFREVSGSFLFEYARCCRNLCTHQ